jgi:hypothetical protein
MTDEQWEQGCRVLHKLVRRECPDANFVYEDDPFIWIDGTRGDYECMLCGANLDGSREELWEPHMLTHLQEHNLLPFL